MENYVYWFTDHYLEYDVLVNIYILLFLYCISMILLKLFAIIKNTHYDKRR